MSEHDFKTADFIVCDEDEAAVREDPAVVVAAVAAVPVGLAEAVPAADSPSAATVDAGGLARYNDGFTRQGLLWMLGWGAAWVLPMLTTAWWIPGMFGDSRVLALVPLLLIIAVPASIMGVIALVAGRGYVKRAQQLCESGERVECRMELKLRPTRQSIYGSTLCEGVLTYPDGRTETIKLLARGMDVSALLGDPIAKVTLVGSPYSSSEPRVVATAFGELLEQPDVGQACNGMLGLFGRKGGGRNYPAIDREFNNSVLLLAHSLIFWPLWCLLIPQSIHYVIWWFVPTFISCGLYGAIRLNMAWKARRLAMLREPALCTVVSEPSHWAERITNKVTMIVAGEGHERRETMSGHVPHKLNKQVIEAHVWYKDGAPWMVAAKDFVLFKQNVRKYALLPAIFYFAALPFLFTINYGAITKTGPVTASSAQEYFDKGVNYKRYGWTEKAREALLKATQMDPNGPVGQKALVYMHSHIPTYPVPEAAEQGNIEAYNLSYSDKPDEAKGLWRDLIAKYPNFEWPYSNLASQLIGEGRAAEAIPLLHRALEINPEYTNALHHMFLAKSQLHDRAGALEYLTRAAQSDPDNAQLRSELFLVKHSI